MSAGVAVTGLAALGPGSLAQTPTCFLGAEQEVGPFYLDDMLIRGKIAEDRVGIPLRLRLVLLDSRTCAPLRDAAIDLWHCDAMGLYSGYTNVSLGGPGGGPGGGPPPGLPPDGMRPRGERAGGAEGGFGGPPPQMQATDKYTFLRGIQFTDGQGAVTFETIFPGFYNGRTNHVHYKVRLAGQRTGEHYAAGHTAHVGQVFFPEDMNVKLMAQGPYAEHKIHRTTEKEDGVFRDEHGSSAIATLVPRDVRQPAMGYVAELHVAVDPTATPKPVGMGAGGHPPRG